MQKRLKSCGYAESFWRTGSQGVPGARPAFVQPLTKCPKVGALCVCVCVRHTLVVMWVQRFGSSLLCPHPPFFFFFSFIFCSSLNVFCFHFRRISASSSFRPSNESWLARRPLEKHKGPGSARYSSPIVGVPQCTNWRWQLSAVDTRLQFAAAAAPQTWKGNGSASEPHVLPGNQIFFTSRFHGPVCPLSSADELTDQQPHSDLHVPATCDPIQLFNYDPRALWAGLCRYHVTGSTVREVFYLQIKSQRKQRQKIFV